MDKVIIREFRTEDLPVVQDIAHGAWQPIYAAFRQMIGDELFEQTRPDPDAKRKQIKQHAETHPEWFIVAETADGKIAGFATYILDEKTRTGISDRIMRKRPIAGSLSVPFVSDICLESHHITDIKIRFSARPVLIEHPCLR